MSSLIVDVSEVKDITDHPNADRLSLVTVKGWQVISGKLEDGSHRYKVGDKVIYCPIDSVLPVDLSDTIEVTKYLSKGRVRTTKLRGEYSQGLIMPLNLVPNSEILNVGDNVAENLSITKYEAPIPVEMAGITAPAHPKFLLYTDVENIKNFPDILEEGEDVYITEKIHGTNFRAAKYDDEFLVGSRKTNLKESDSNLYWRATKIHNLKEILPDGYQIFGEVYGKGVQKLHYDLKEITVRYFDLMIENKYANYDQFKTFCEEHDLPMAPLLFEGPWKRELLSLAEGESTLAKHIKEGIVITPSNEKWDGKVGRVIMKHINEKYLLKDYGDLQ